MNENGPANRVCLQLSIIALLLLTHGCGGGGSSDDPNETENPPDNDSATFTGSETQAVVTESNARDLAMATASGASGR
ncbi:MAG: hypothetical protein KZQ95_21930 [Candidatus Thiodiazotropha sp. (ex Epidulcina cf. delphinae)]|nr:hypothetical protein [Candidatus Thiodiazotropha sp. (ex Epidulcina cf. delphinae)]